MTELFNTTEPDDALDLLFKSEISKHPGASVDHRTRRVIRRMARKAVRDNPEASLSEIKDLVEAEFRTYAERGGDITPKGDFANDECAVPWVLILQLIILAVRFWMNWRRK